MTKRKVEIQSEPEAENQSICRGRFSGVGILDLTVFTAKVGRELKDGPTNTYRNFLRRKLNPRKRLRNDVPAMERLYVERFEVNPLHGFFCFQLGIQGAEGHIASSMRQFTEELAYNGEYY